MNEGIRSQSANGHGNTQVGNDFNQNHIQIYNILSDPSFPTDLDQALQVTVASLEATQKRLTKTEEKILFCLFLIFLASFLSFAAFLGNYWVHLILSLSGSAFFSWRMVKPISERALIKIDKKAHQDVLGELCKRKILEKIG